jgi:hypothetical protein
MELFCVTREGVYRHQIAGIWSNVTVASEAAVSIIRRECDDYHHYEIHRFTLDVLPTPQVREDDASCYTECPFEVTSLIATIGRVALGKTIPYWLADLIRKTTAFSPNSPFVYVYNHQTESISYVQL